MEFIRADMQLACAGYILSLVCWIKVTLWLCGDWTSIPRRSQFFRLLTVPQISEFPVSGDGFLPAEDLAPGGLIASTLCGFSFSQLGIDSRFFLIQVVYSQPPCKCNQSKLLISLYFEGGCN